MPVNKFVCTEHGRRVFGNSLRILRDIFSRVKWNLNHDITEGLSLFVFIPNRLKMTRQM